MTTPLALELTPRALSALPIFPLPNCVLLPGGLMPLHVFEPRYRQLTRDCLAGEQVMGVARLRPGYEADYDGRPAVYSQLGVGKVMASEELPDGRYLLLLRGIARVDLVEELPARKQYREIRARILADKQVDPAQLTACHAKLVGLCDRLAQLLEQGGGQLRDLVRTGDPGACADAVAAALAQDPDERQVLLECLCPVSRLERTIQLVGSLLCELAPCEGEAN
jgi:Lon protease-like protein